MSNDILQLDDLLTEDMLEFDGGNEQIEVSGDSITVYAGLWTTTRETIAVGDKEHSFNVRYKFIDPILTSILMRETNTTTGTRPNPVGPRIDCNATVVSQRVLELQVGDTWMREQDFVLKMLRMANPSLTRSDDEILQDLKSYGFDPRGRVPMYLQHLGASNEGFALNAADFVSRGARNNTEEVKRRAQGQKSVVKGSFRHDQGVKIVSMEISKANRALSQTRSGFIGFADGAWGTVTQIVKLDRQRSAIRRILEDENSTTDVKKAAADEDTRIKNLFANTRSRRAFHNWGGTTAVVDILQDDKVAYYSQQVPCGRYTVASDYVIEGKGDEATLKPINPTMYSVWNRAENNPGGANSHVVGSAGIEAANLGDLVLPTDQAGF